MGLISAIVAYYIVHEGAHFLYALSIDVFRQIHFMGFGVQVDVFADVMTPFQMAMFCVVGSISTLIFGYILVFVSGYVKRISSKMLKAALYYITIALLFIDPLYLSVLCSFVGGGDMNGISLLMPEVVVRVIYGFVFVLNILILKRIVLVNYQKAFE